MLGARRYRLAGQLGKGGMAEVLEAHALGEAGFERRVAIKRMLPSALGDASFARMFLDEARIASRLHHANIVSILDYGIVDGVPFQVLEFIDGVDGRTLVRRAPGGRVPVELALYICAQVGHALSHAHSARDAEAAPLGIVHRDVSPGNVLLSWEGDVKLADFGIAFAQNKLEKTEFGMTKGTPAYMSPEQAIGAGVDVRADLFSLGCVLHALLVGRSPLADGAHLEFFNTRQLEIDATIPEDARSIIRQATFFDREERFRSASALTEALGQALAARTERDPRMAMKTYLDALRPAVKPAPAKLDELFDVEIVLEDDTDGTRRFSIAPGGADTARMSAPGGIDETMVDTAAAVRGAGLAPPRRSWLAGGAVAIAVIGAGTFGVIRSGAFRPSAASPAPAASDPVPAESHASDSVVLPVSPSVSAAATLASASAGRSVPPVRSGRANDPKPSVPAASASAPIPNDCEGTIYLNCPAATRAHVILDGRARPEQSGDRISKAPCGSHTVAFVDAVKGKDVVTVRVERAQLTTAACGLLPD